MSHDIKQFKPGDKAKHHRGIVTILGPEDTTNYYRGQPQSNYVLVLEADGTKMWVANANLGAIDD